MPCTSLSMPSTLIPLPSITLAQACSEDLPDSANFRAIEANNAFEASLEIKESVIWDGFLFCFRACTFATSRHQHSQL